MASRGIPRIRVFAGPNGSGKTTLIQQFSDQLKGIYVNPDWIEADLRRLGEIDLCDFGIEGSSDHIIPVLAGHDQFSLSRYGTLPELDGYKLRWSGDFDSYGVAALCDVMRRQAVELGISFSFETVLSSASKLEFLEDAREVGYRVYLYFVATVDADINVSRVDARVKDGGHHVPDEKIRSRYLRSLSNLRRAVFLSDRGFLFDNSSDLNSPVWLIETERLGDEIFAELKESEIPHWVWRYFLDSAEFEARDVE